MRTAAPPAVHDLADLTAALLPALRDLGVFGIAVSEDAGGSVLSGMCFYQSYAREMSVAKGWKRLATNSAKLVNILGGYGYVPMIASMEACVKAAETGELK